jgi:hypothetical protein
VVVVLDVVGAVVVDATVVVGAAVVVVAIVVVAIVVVLDDVVDVLVDVDETEEVLDDEEDVDESVVCAFACKGIVTDAMDKAAIVARAVSEMQREDPSAAAGRGRWPSRRVRSTRGEVIRVIATSFAA